VRALGAAAARLAAGDLRTHIEVDGPDEIRALARSLGEMAAGLQAHVTALTEERNRATLVQSHMTDGIVIVDRQGSVQRVNAAAARLLRVDAAGRIGQSVATVVRDHEIRQVLATALAEGKPHASTVRLAFPTHAAVPAPGSPNAASPAPGPANCPPAADEVRYVRATGIPIAQGSAPGDPAGLLVLQDVTELRRTEDSRRDFVANVSHELRTPLASLKALAETLEEGALDDPPAAREFLGQIHVEVDSLAQLVQEILELSRIESGQAPLHPQVLPAAAVAADAGRRLRRGADRAGLKLVVQVDDAGAVNADPARIVQVLINLLHNAVKFTPSGGRITLRVAPDGEDAVRFSVADTGIGIAPHHLPRLFERFYKVDRSRASDGTGLGLAIAKHIVQAHGGQIWAESAGEGRGATFAFTLPRAPLPEPPPATPPPASSASSASNSSSRSRQDGASTPPTRRYLQPDSALDCGALPPRPPTTRRPLVELVNQGQTGAKDLQEFTGDPLRRTMARN
jgi:two-component system phosphate regulon sensor histidine kinase PhoR